MAPLRHALGDLRHDELHERVEEGSSQDGHVPRLQLFQGHRGLGFEAASRESPRGVGGERLGAPSRSGYFIAATISTTATWNHHGGADAPTGPR